MNKKELEEKLAEIHSAIDELQGDARLLYKQAQDIMGQLEEIPENLEGIQDIIEKDV